MAIYHLHVGIIKRSSGRSAVAAAAYRAADKLHSEHDDITHDYSPKSSAVNAAAYRAGESLKNEHSGAMHDYTYKTGVVHTEIMLPENAPKEYSDRSTLWNAVEKAEKRKDAQTAREIDIALPVELDRSEQITLVREYVKDNFVDVGMCADFAIHDKGDGNPHAHIMLTTREVSAAGFGGKNRDWNKTEYLEQWRKNWADCCNERLQSKELDERIDHRALKAQGIDREPTIHIGVAGKYMEHRGIEHSRTKTNREIRPGVTNIAFSPLAEKLWRRVSGIRPLRLRSEKERLLPLFREVYRASFAIDPNLFKRIILCIKEDMTINAYAFGKRTLGLTRGSITLLDDDCLKGLIAHEFGHFSHRDTEAVLLSTVSNFFMSFLIRKLTDIKNRLDADKKGGIIFSIFKGLFDIIYYLFRSIDFIGELILMRTSRQNEYLADQFALKSGFGKDLTDVLIQIYEVSAEKPQRVKEQMKRTHPHITLRIQQLEKAIY